MVAFSLAFGLSAQETLTLEQCQEMALEYNKEMAAAARQTDQSRYTAKSYKGNFFPDFTASGTGFYNTADGTFGTEGGYLPTFDTDASGQLSSNGGYAYFPGLSLDYKIKDVYSVGVQMDQPLYMGGKIRAAYKMATLGTEMSQMNERLTATEVILKTDEAYAQVVKAKEMKVVADMYNAVLIELMKNVRSAHEHGLKPLNDVLKVQVRLNESELSIRKAENAIRLASMNLCHYIGKPLTTEIEVVNDLLSTEQEPVVNTLDITGRPEYEILNKQVAIASQQVKLNRSEMLPNVGLRGSYSYLHGLEVNGENLIDKGSFSVMVNVSVPLFHFGSRSNKVRAAKAKLLQTQLEQEDMNEQMMLELTQAINNLDEAQLELDLAERSLEQAEENMRVSKTQFEVGLETLSDHLEAQALWQQAYEQKVDANYQLYLKYISYQKAAGTLMK